MKLAPLLNLDAPLPADPFEALLLVRARAMKLAARTAEVMAAIYPDYTRCVERIVEQEARAESAVGSFGASGGGDA